VGDSSTVRFFHKVFGFFDIRPLPPGGWLLVKEEKDLLFAQPIVGIGIGVCSLSKVAYLLAKTTKTMDFCQLFCGFEPTLGNLQFHYTMDHARWQSGNAKIFSYIIWLLASVNRID
jgi:hypothetical protein